MDLFSRPRAGTRLTIVPNLAGVSDGDVPSVSQRRVEILEATNERLRVRWSSRVLVERVESARRRDKWIRARSNAGPNTTPPPDVGAEYDEREEAGTIDLPGFSTAAAFLLPGLWPQGNASLPGGALLWLPPPMLAQLRTSGEARLGLVLESPLLKDPAAFLLRRAASLWRNRSKDAESGEMDLWRITGKPERALVSVGGKERDVDSFRATCGIGWMEILADEECALVVAAQVEGQPGLRLAPASLIRVLLSYRIVSIESDEP